MSSQAIIDRLEELPSLPAIYLRVRETLADPDGSLEEAARIIETDAALTARLLRVANSALYALPGRVDSVMRALTVIGTEETEDLVLATSVISVFRDLPLGAVSMRSFWEHSLACAIAARTIARRIGSHGVQQAYVAGLLHDIGRLPLFILEPQAMSSALQAHRDGANHLWILEQEILGTDHAKVGGRLLEYWGLPPSYASATSFHHEPQVTLSQEAAIAHVADFIVNGLKIGTSGTRLVPALDDAAWQRIGLDATDLAPIVETTLSTARDVASAFLEH